MNSTLNPIPGGPDTILAARADERLAHVYEQIAQADEQLARVTEHLSKMEHDAVQHPSAVARLQPSHSSPALRGIVGLALAACIGGAAYAAQSSYGEAARVTIAQWAPNLVSTSSPWSQKPGDSAQPRMPGVQLAAGETTSAQPAASAQTPTQDVAPAPLPPELTQLLQAMARDIATVEQGIEQLKANQERMGAENARAIEQLRASQEQMARLVAKPSEADTRARTATPTPSARPVAAAAHKPPPPPQAGARPRPIQLQPKEQ
jgi:predicted FMN-binding regulatory protein PaiB